MSKPSHSPGARGARAGSPHLTDLHGAPAEEGSVFAGPASEKLALLKHARQVGSLTLASRVVGMFRDIVNAGLFGTGMVWDAFVYAFMIPNFLRGLVAEGALSSAFIPVYAQVRKEGGPQAAFRFGRLILNGLAIAWLGALALVYLALAWVPQAFGLSPKLALAIELLRVVFPYIVFLSLAAVCMAMLNSENHFVIPALSPCLMNFIWLLAVGVACPLAGGSLERQAFVLAAIVSVGGLIQLVLNGGALSRRGFRWRWEWKHDDPLAGRFFALLAPAALGYAITQVNLFIDLSFGFFLGDGASSSLWYGNRLMQFPMGIISIAMATALFPLLSRAAASRDHVQLEETLTFSLKTVFLIILPASAGLIVLSEPIMRVLFERGRFDEVSTLRASRVLVCYAIGLFAHSGSKLLRAAFYSLQDVKMPVRVGAAAVTLNVVLNLILMRYLAEAGLALATTLSGIFEFAVLMVLLKAKIHFPGARALARVSLQALAASAVMAALVTVLFDWMSARLAPMGFWGEALALAAVMALGAAAYAGLARLFGVRELARAVQTLSRKAP